jgi:hypothetical protein
MREAIPAIGRYRGVELHAFQTEQRIRDVVVPEIDLVLTMEDVGALVTFLANAEHAPEGRLLAFRRLIAPAEHAKAARQKSTLDIDRIKATVAALDSLHWADPSRYCALTDVTRPGVRLPERPLACRNALERARAALKYVAADGIALGVVADGPGRLQMRGERGRRSSPPTTPLERRIARPLSSCELDQLPICLDLRYTP